MDDVLTTLAEHPEVAGWVALLFVLAMLRDAIGWVGRKAWEWYDHRKGNGMQGTIKANTIALTEVKSALEAAANIDPPPYPQCHYAPDHFHQIERIDVGVASMVKFNEDLTKEIAAGNYGCQMIGDRAETVDRIRFRMDEGKL